jgi:hypothetical protein
VGDVNDSAIPNSINGSTTEDRNLEAVLHLITKDFQLSAGQEYEVPFYVNTIEEIAGLQFTLDFDKEILSYTGLQESALGSFNQQNIGTTHNDEGLLTLSWENASGQKMPQNAAFFTLRFKAKANARLLDALAINSKITPAEAYIGNLTSTNSGFSEKAVSLTFNEASASEFLVYSNTPNPFYQSTRIKVFLPEATEVNIHVYDALGRLLKAQREFFESGIQEIALDMDKVPARGLLFAEIEARGYKPQTLKMFATSD